MRLRQPTMEPPREPNLRVTSTHACLPARLHAPESRVDGWFKPFNRMLMPRVSSHRRRRSLQERCLPYVAIHPPPSPKSHSTCRPVSDYYPIGFPDPFAVATINGEQTKTTGVIKKTLNPYWNESFDMCVARPPSFPPDSPSMIGLCRLSSISYCPTPHFPCLC